MKVHLDWMGTKQGYFPAHVYMSIQNKCCAISFKIYSGISQEPVYQVQAFSQSPRAPFNSLQFPHLLKQPLNTITDGFSGHQAQTLYPSLSKRKQHQAKNNVSIKSFWGEDWVSQPQQGPGRFWRGNEAILGSTWHEIE